MVSIMSKKLIVFILLSLFACIAIAYVISPSAKYATPINFETMKEIVAEENLILDIVLDNNITYLIFENEKNQDTYIKICKEVSTKYFQKDKSVKSMTLIIGSPDINYYAAHIDSKGLYSENPDPNFSFANSKGKFNK